MAKKFKHADEVAESLTELEEAARDAARNVARVAAAGKSSKEGRVGIFRDRRKLLSFSTVVVLILALGTALVIYAQQTRDVSAQPRQNKDHWHSAYGVYDCAGAEGKGAFEPHFQTSTNDVAFENRVGIHSHQDSVIHIHPFYERASGKGAKISHFFTAMKAEINDQYIMMPDGRRLEAGVECNGSPSIITVFRWRDINNLGKDPVIYKKNLGDVRFLNDGEAFVFARAPEGFDVPRPPNTAIDNTHKANPTLQSRLPIEPTEDTTETSTTTTQTP